jgi:preprotein translocase subunit SecG
MNPLPLFTLGAWNPTVVGVIMVLFIVICVFMVLTILIQKPQGGGLGAAFGGGSASSGQTAFGTKTGDALTVFTVLVFVAFLVFAVLLNLGMKPDKAAAAPAAQGTGGTTTAPANTPATTPTETPAPVGGEAPTPLTPAPGTSEAAPGATPAATPATTPVSAPAPAPTPEPVPTSTPK